jgi:hypothetical protein
LIITESPSQSQYPVARILGSLWAAEPIKQRGISDQIIREIGPLISMRPTSVGEAAAPLAMLVGEEE